MGTSEKHTHITVYQTLLCTLMIRRAVSSDMGGSEPGVALAIAPFIEQIRLLVHTVLV